MTQDTAFSILKTGANVFLTGEPGAGKTHTVNRYVAWLRSHGIEPAITASTGIAATHIGGMTIHSWSGIGIKTRLTSDDKRKMMDNNRLMTRMAKTRVLIIDEISMLEARTLDAVDIACRTLKQTDAAFGGMQVVLVGDFFQLPPIVRPVMPTVESDDGAQTLFDEDDGSQDEEPSSPFAFHASAWRSAEPSVCYLSEQHRQEDTAFLSLLAAMRQGHMHEQGMQLLRARRTAAPKDGLHTRLYAHNANVDRVNDAQLKALPGDARVFDMRSFGSARFVESLKKSCLSPEQLALKVGARVMFTKNNPEAGFVNGTLGEVMGFDPESGLPVVKTVRGWQIKAVPMDWAIADGNKELGKITQLPLRLAWAITIHKSQGMTLDAAEIDLSGAFEYGQGYVALSRVRSSEGLYLVGWNARALEVHPEIRSCDNQLKRQSALAREAAESCAPTEQTQAERTFIRLCGGSVEEISVHEQQERAPKPPKEKGPSTLDQTLALFTAGKTLAEIAEARELVTSTITAHIELLVKEGKLAPGDVVRIVPANLTPHLPVLHAALKKASGHLAPARAALKNRFSFEDIRLARIVMDESAD
jgi:ATP-dependent DNA helicase PIF1